MLLDVALFSTQLDKARILGQVDEFREWSSTYSYTSV